MWPSLGVPFLPVATKAGEYPMGQPPNINVRLSFSPKCIFSLLMYSPVMVHSLMGIFSTLTNIYFSRDGEWSTFAKVSVAIMTAWLSVAGMLSIWCELWISELQSNKRPNGLAIKKDGIISNFRLGQSHNAARTYAKYDTHLSDLVD